MILKIFTSTKSPAEAIEKANKEIQKMMPTGYDVKEIAQSESTFYNSFAEQEQFHFTITILFRKKIQNKE